MRVARQIVDRIEPGDLLGDVDARTGRQAIRLVGGADRQADFALVEVRLVDDL